MSDVFVRVCRAPRVQPPAERLLAIYRSEPTRRLQSLQRALEQERRDKIDTDTITFCDHRLPLIAQVLAEREPAQQSGQIQPQDAKLKNP